MTLAGIPITVVKLSTFLVTTAFAPTLDCFPIVIGPSILAPAPIIASSLIVGCLFPFLS